MRLTANKVFAAIVVVLVLSTSVLVGKVITLESRVAQLEALTTPQVLPVR